MIAKSRGKNAREADTQIVLSKKYANKRPDLLRPFICV